MRLGDLVAEIEVLAVQVDGEGGVVVAAHQRRSGRLPGEAVAAAGANRIPKLVQVQPRLLGCFEKGRVGKRVNGIGQA